MKARLLAAWAFLLLSAFSLAQLPGGLQLPNVEYNPLLLINAAVQKELKLSPQKAATVQNAFMQEAMKLLPAVTSGQGAKPLTPTQRKTMIYAGIERMQTRLAAMLNPAQRVRLRQLTLQSIGPTAVLQPKVAAVLGLTKLQRSQLEDELGAANEKIATNLGDRTPQSMQSKLSRITRLQAQAKAAGAKALAATLTAPQRAKWQAMLGKPFALSGFLGAGSLGSMMGGG